MSSALLPCPFCEGEARVMLEEEDSPDDCFHNIYCTVCGAQFWVKSKTEAIAVWNRRAQPENNPLTLDSICESLEEYRIGKTVSHFTYARDCENFRDGVEAAIAVIRDMAKPERIEVE